MFEKLKNIKTPHGNPVKHLCNLFGYFLAASLVVVFFGLGVKVVGWSWLAGAAVGVTAAIALVGGIFVT